MCALTDTEWQDLILGDLRRKVDGSYNFRLYLSPRHVEMIFARDLRRNFVSRASSCIRKRSSDATGKRKIHENPLTSIRAT